MKTLYLIRHAKSSWDNPSLKDYDRPLNERGKINAAEMGKRLAKNKAKPGTVIASSAKRTKKTAQKIAKELGFDKKKIQLKEELYHCSNYYMLQAVNAIKDKHQEAILVGHNPTTASFCDYLTGEYYDFPTCAVARIDFEVDSWQEVSNGLGKLAWYDYPKNI